MGFINIKINNPNRNDVVAKIKKKFSYLNIQKTKELKDLYYF